MPGQAEVIVITTIALVLFSEWNQETSIAIGLSALVAFGAYGILASVPLSWWLWIAVTALLVGAPLALRKYPESWDWFLPVLAAMVNLIANVVVFLWSGDSPTSPRAVLVVASAFAAGIALHVGARKARERSRAEQSAVAASRARLWNYLSLWLKYWTWRLIPFAPLAGWALVERFLWSRPWAGWIFSLLAISLHIVARRISGELRAELLARQAA